MLRSLSSVVICALPQRWTPSAARFRSAILRLSVPVLSRMRRPPMVPVSHQNGEPARQVTRRDIGGWPPGRPSRLAHRTANAVPGATPAHDARARCPVPGGQTRGSGRRCRAGLGEAQPLYRCMVHPFTESPVAVVLGGRWGRSASSGSIVIPGVVRRRRCRIHSPLGKPVVEVRPQPADTAPVQVDRRHDRSDLVTESARRE